MDDVLKSLMEGLIEHLRMLEAEDKEAGEERDMADGDISDAVEGAEEMVGHDLDGDDEMDEDHEEYVDEEDEPEETLQQRMHREMKASGHPPAAAMEVMVSPRKGMVEVKKEVRRRK